MSTIINAAPRVILNGIDDQSARPMPREPEQIPMHLPQFFGFAQKGPSDSQLLGSMTEINQIYGIRTMDYKDKYATHVTPFITTVLARANRVMFKRLIPSDAETGNVALKLHVTETKLPVYERNPDGTYKLDENGDRIVIPDKEVEGYNLKWELSEIDRSVGSKQMEVVKLDSKTTVYPILEFEASSPGDFSGNVGFKLSVPTASDTSPPDMDLMEQNKTLLLRFTMLERLDELSSPNVLSTLGGETSVDFTLKDSVVDKYGIEKYYKKAVIPSYEDISNPGFSPIYSPIGKMYLYTDNHEVVSGLILKAEIESVAVTGDTNVDSENMGLYEVNYFSGITRQDVPFTTINYDLSAVHGKNFTTINEYNIKYLNKGKDGNISEANLDKEVLNVMMYGWEDPDDPLSDMATRPFSAIWDSGFSLETKKGLCETLGRRKDAYVLLSTFEHGGDSLSWTEEESVANVLKTYASGYPESEIYGTPVCRALVISDRGDMSDNVWKERVPLSVDLADKVALFMGAGNGMMTEGRGFDTSPNNQITMIKNVTGLYKPERQRQKDWDAGMVYAQSYDRRSSFYPAVQTVYPDDTSVLNSAINMFIAAELQKVCENVWKNITGGKLTSEQLIERSNAMITENTLNRFDDRVVIVPETFYTAADTARGFSWSCRINMYASNMKTVGAFTIVSRRRDDLAA